MIDEHLPEGQFERVLDSIEGRTLGIKHPKLRMFAVNDFGLPSLLIETSTHVVSRQLLPTRGIDVRVTNGPGGTSKVTMTARSRGMIGAFLAMVRHLIEWTAGATSEADAVSRLTGAYEEFRRMLQGQTRPSEDVIRGLFAELLVLERLIANGGGPQMVRHWAGPFRGSKDFVLPSGQAIEVKSIRYDARSVKISSVDQLEPKGLDLELHLVPMERTEATDDKALRLVDLVDRIRRIVSSDPESGDQLNRALDAFGYSEIAPTIREVAFIIRPTRRFRVTEEFPRIRASDLVQGIQAVKYELQVHDLDGFACTDQVQDLGE